MDHREPLTLLAIASYEKGHAFLEQAKAEGCRVLLLTSESLRHTAQWPTQAIDAIHYMPDTNQEWDRQEMIRRVSLLARHEDIGRIVALDDFDQEKAAMLREHLRIKGMGESTVRFFRDKLAMRLQADEAGVPVPEFIHALNHARVHEYTQRVPAPWILKPRMYAGAIGVKRLNSAGELWAALESLGDDQSNYLIERFLPGAVFHVDTVIYERDIRFAIASGYGRPPMEVAQQGGVFTTHVLERGSALEQQLQTLNRRVLAAMGLARGVSHTEYIQGHDGKLYFLETSARVGGAHIADLVEAASGVNLWREWARIEVAGGLENYHPNVVRQDHAGLLVSLARQEWPDTSAYTYPEIVWRMRRQHHVGMIVQSPSYARVMELTNEIAGRIANDFTAVAPPKDRPTN